jgi:uncharacterized protein YjbI with pentapeptide repeats
MVAVNWILRHKILTILIGLAVSALILCVLLVYIKPENATHRKDVVQVFAIIIAGIVGVIGAAVGLSNLRIGRENLEHNRNALEQNLSVAQQNLEQNQRALREQLDHQRELEDIRAQDGALQAYFEQMGDLLTDHGLGTTDREDIKLLARAQTFTVLARLDEPRKGSLVRFLHGAGLIKRDKPIVEMSTADLTNADLRRANLGAADLSNAFLSRVDLSNAFLVETKLRHAVLTNAILVDAVLIDADLRNANLGMANLGEAHLENALLVDANLWSADLSGADLSDAKVAEQQLATCKSLEGATMPNGQKYEDWLKTKTN